LEIKKEMTKNNRRMVRNMEKIGSARVNKNEENDYDSKGRSVNTSRREGYSRRGICGK